MQKALRKGTATKAQLVDEVAAINKKLTKKLQGDVPASDIHRSSGESGTSAAEDTAVLK